MNTDLKAKIDASATASLKNAGQLEVLVLQHEGFNAEIALQGAQLLSFTPKHQHNWLWLSPRETFETHKAIRGGIPICLPWFGVNQQAPNKPKHGFARNRCWQLTRFEESEQRCTIAFAFNYDGTETSLFEHAFIAHLTLTLGSSIDLQLEVQNLSHSNLPISFAFHSYFSIDDLASVKVSGLENAQYLDNTEGLCQKLQKNAIRFEGEVDRVFEKITDPQKIIQTQTLSIESNNCPSCIVWNPGHKVASTITDISEHYNDFICVERGAAFSDSLTLAPQQTHTFNMIVTN